MSEHQPIAATIVDEPKPQWLCIYSVSPGNNPEGMVAIGYGQTAQEAMEHGIPTALMISIELGLVALLSSTTHAAQQNHMTPAEFERVCNLIDEARAKQGIDR